jgi:hypothetical protein
VNDGVELLGKTGDLKCGLAVVLVQVELPALGAGVSGGVGVIDGARNAVDAQHTSQRESAQAGADDRNGGGGGGHQGLLISGMAFQ